MATPFTLPKHLFTGSARQQLIDGLEGGLRPLLPARVAHALGDADLRWDEMTTRAVQRVLPEVAALLDAAIAAEWQKGPIEVERALKAVPA